MQARLPEIDTLKEKMAALEAELTQARTQAEEQGRAAELREKELTDAKAWLESQVILTPILVYSPDSFTSVWTSSSVFLHTCSILIFHRARATITTMLTKSAMPCCKVNYIRLCD